MNYAILIIVMVKYSIRRIVNLKIVDQFPIQYTIYTLHFTLYSVHMDMPWFQRFNCHNKEIENNDLLNTYDILHVNNYFGIC